MSQIHTITITAPQAGQRLDKIFSVALEKTSRSFLQRYGIFKKADQEKPYKTKAQEGDIWVLEIPEAFDPHTLLTPWDYPLTVLQETDQWVAIDKPVGISVHPSPSEKSHKTIVNALLQQYGINNLSSYYEEDNGIKMPRIGIVHRLDKPTSGVLLVAKNNATHAQIQKHWDQVEKIYYAVVEGTPPPKGHIEGALLRDPHDKVKMVISRSPSAKAAQTSFEVVGPWEEKSATQPMTLLKIQIHTGRTHQIRVHLSSIGFPIIGDPIYGTTPYARMMLHAHRLTFPNPEKPEEKITLEAPLPEEFGPGDY